LTRDPSVTEVGDPVDKFLARSEAMSLGLITRTTDGSFALGIGGIPGPQGVSGPPGATGAGYPTPDYTAPPTPTGFTVGAGITRIYLQWDAPSYTAGHGNALTLVYGAIWLPGDAEPTFGDVRTKLITSAALALNLISYPTEPNTRWCLWIAFFTVDGISGVPSSHIAGGAHGAQATTGQDVSALLTVLAGQITSSQLYSSLASTIALIDPGATGQTVDFRIGVETTARSAETGFLGGLYTVRAQASQDGQTVVGGFGLSGTTGGTAGPSIQFGVIANRFWVAAPAGTIGAPADIQPFVIQTAPETINGVVIPAGVYMDAAYIKNLTAMVARLGTAWIDDAKIANLSAAKLTAGSGVIGGPLMSSNYVASVSGWTLNPSGFAEFGAAAIRGQLVASQIDGTNLTISDASGIILGAGHLLGSQYLKASGNFNLVDSSGWTVGTTGNQGTSPQHWANSGLPSSEDTVVMVASPDGIQRPCWRALSSDSGTGGAPAIADGGADYDTFAIDATKQYRFAIWFQVTGSNASGFVFLGPGQSTVKTIGGATNTDPFFISNSRGTFTLGRWYLMVGFVMPTSYTGVVSEGGVYDTTTGQRVLTGNNFAWVAAQATTNFRFYQRNGQIGDGAYFWGPMVHLCDGTEPKLQELLATGAISALNPLTTGNVGVYMPTAAIGNAQIDRATVNKLQVTNADIAGDIQSTNFVSGVSGWIIQRSGYAEFGNVKVRGDVQATSLNGVIVDTSNLVADAIHAISPASGTGASVSTSVTVPAGQTWTIVTQGFQASGLTSVINTPPVSAGSVSLTGLGSVIVPQAIFGFGASGEGGPDSYGVGLQPINVTWVETVVGPQTYTSTFTGEAGTYKAITMIAYKR
jgi:hypothetical protein